MGEERKDRDAQVGLWAFYFMVALCVAIYVGFWFIPEELARKRIEVGFFAKIIGVVVSTICGTLGFAIACLIKKIFTPNFVIGRTTDVIGYKIFWGLIVPVIGLAGGAVMPTMQLLRWWYGLI